MPPALSEVARLSGDVKRSLHLSPGAPELVLNLGSSATLNVEWRWALTQLRLWQKISSSPDGHELLAGLHVKKQQSRLSALVRFLTKKGWSLEPRRIKTLWRDISPCLGLG